MTDEFRKVLDLIKKTGDKLVFYDSSNDSSFVILPLNQYEKLLSPQAEVKGLTEEELLDKINHDIARWREEQSLEKDSHPEEKIASTAIDQIGKSIPAGEDVYQPEPLEE